MALLLLLLLALQASSACAYVSTYPAAKSSLQTSGNDTVPLYIALIMSFGGEFNSSGTLPGVQVALDLINNRTDLLPGYSLHYAATDSQVKK